MMFDENCLTANPVFFRTYSRVIEGLREQWLDVCLRTSEATSNLGNLTPVERQLVFEMQTKLLAFSSGRWLWVGGTDWVKKPENYYGAYNCSSTDIDSWDAFAYVMSLAMQGCGTGAVLEDKHISKLPPIINKLEVSVEGEFGGVTKENRIDNSTMEFKSVAAKMRAFIKVGDSRQGWVQAYQYLLTIASENFNLIAIPVVIDISNVRAKGERLNGFGGVANPIKLKNTFIRIAEILNGAVGRQLTSVECCLLIDEAALAVVAGNVRRSAGIRQGDAKDEAFAIAKDNLWQQGEDGNWRIDPKRDALRMANHTRVFHQKPTLEECIESVTKQYWSGEGAIQWAGEAVARANADLLNRPELKQRFLQHYKTNRSEARTFLQVLDHTLDAKELDHRMGRYGINPCHSGDTLISTDKGLIPIKDLVGKDFKALIDLRVTGLSGTKLTDAIAFCTGTKPTYLIKLQNGQYMKCTNDHKHFTDKGWVKTKDLTEDHSIFIQRGEGSFGEATITIEQAQMLGWWYGDGYNVTIKAHRTGRKTDCQAKGFVFNQEDYETAYSIIGGAIRGITGRTHTPRLHKGVYEFRTQSPKVEEFFDCLGIEDKSRIPEKLLCQSKDILIGFIQGLFSADGSVDKDSRRVVLRNKHLEILQQLQIVLLQLGISSRLRCAVQQGEKGVPYKTVDGTEKISANNGSYTLSIFSFSFELFYHLVGFPISKSKQARLENWVINKPVPNYTEKTVNSKFTSKVKSVSLYSEEPVYDLNVPLTHSYVANGCITHNCGEIILNNNMCNLSEVHLNNIEPHDNETQAKAFTAATLSACALLNHKFPDDRYQYSREIDPIIGVSFTGLFDFFVNLFGVGWLNWWAEGRPQTEAGGIYRETEKEYLVKWRKTVEAVTRDYCERHRLRVPNRCTTVQPAGTKSLLTGASPGWHPPKAARFIRRITFGKNDPVALACLQYGYNVVPAQSDKDEDGNLLTDPYDERCTEWLVEIPVAANWANLPGVDEVDINKFSAIAQFDFYMQVQKHYTTHNSSSTLELQESEIGELATAIHKAIINDEGYMSSAILSRMDDFQSFPRLPFEPISKAKYEELMTQVKARSEGKHFYELIARYDKGIGEEAGPMACDSDKCLFPTPF